MEEKLVNQTQQEVCVNAREGKPRNSNLELFRIITMLLIVAHHYVVNSQLTAADGPIYADPMSWRSLLLLVIGAFGKTGINCFVLITGYFMCKSQITVKKFCKLLFEIELYKIVIWLIFFVSGYEAFSLMSLVKALLPVRNISSGFTSCYLVFFLFIPFLNILTGNMTEKQHIKLVLLCAFVYIVIGTLPRFGVTMNYVSWFIVLYFIGSYIRLYDRQLFSNTRFWGWATLIILLISIASVVGMTWLGAKLGKGGIEYWFLSDSNKVLAVALALAAFMFFKNVRIKNSVLINTVAASTLGVLMIHANSDTMRKWLWQDVLHNVEMYNSNFLVFHVLGSVLAIYIICTAIDYLRIRFIEKPFFSLWDKHWDSFKGTYNKVEDRLCKALKISG